MKKIETAYYIFLYSQLITIPKHISYGTIFVLIIKSSVMHILEKLWGVGTSLDALQMGVRGIVVFIVALLLIRISGRRSFGIGSPLDNIIVILLGAILSRSVVGASPFIPVVVTCLTIVLLHRFFSWLKRKNMTFSNLIEGKKILVFKEGEFLQDNMEKALVCKEDILQGIRKSALTDDLNLIKYVYVEYTGEISVVKKDELFS